jgi:hypothetical protein
MTNRGVIFIFKGNLHKNLVVRAIGPDSINAKLIWAISWAEECGTIFIGRDYFDTHRAALSVRRKVHFTGAWTHSLFKPSNLTHEH